MTDPNLPETTLALLIQEGRATEPAIAAALARQFAPGVQRLTLSLLNGRSAAALTAATLTQQTFANALNTPESFEGKEDIRAWLYAQALAATRTLPRPYKAAPGTPPSQPGGPSYPELYTLPDRERLPLLLRYGHRMTLPAIAQTLHTTEHKVHQQLHRARLNLVKNFLIAPQKAQKTHHPKQLALLLDNLLDPDQEPDLRAHLETCPTCQNYLTPFIDLETRLIAALSPETPLSDDQIEAILLATRALQQTQASLKESRASLLTALQARLPRLPFKEIAWVVIAAAIFLALAIRLNPFFSSPPEITPTPIPERTLPPAQQLSTVFRQTNGNTLPEIFPNQHTLWRLTNYYTGEYLPTTPIFFNFAGDTVAFGDETNVIVWNLLNARGQKVQKGHEAIVTALAFNTNGDMLATGDESGQVLLWDVASERIRFRLNDHPGPIHELTFSLEGNYLAVALNDGYWLWEIGEKSVVRILAMEWDWIRAITFSPDGRLLATADRESTVALWNIPDGKFLLRYETIHGTQRENSFDFMTQLAFSPDGSKLASSSFDGNVEVVALSRQGDQLQAARLFVLPHPSWVSDVQWAPDGRMLATIADNSKMQAQDVANRGVYLWDMETGTLLHPPLSARAASGLSRLQFHPLGNKMVVSSFEGVLFEWEMADISHLIAAYPEGRFFTRVETNTLKNPSFPEQATRIYLDVQTPLAEAGIVALSPLPGYTLLYGFTENTLTELTYQNQRGDTFVLTQQSAKEQPATAEDMIGASALILPIQLRGLVGEYVEGNWVSTSPDNPTPDAHIVRWLPTGLSRLRWEQDGIMFELSIQLFALEQRANLFSKVDEMFRLAENIVAQSEPPLLLTYTIQDGDTCIGIAQQFGTDVARIAQANGLDNCDLIVTGNALLVPLPSGREALTQVDLNCDVMEERIRVIPNPNIADLTANFGVVVEAIPEGLVPDRGHYWPVWEITIANAPVQFFGLPSIVELPGCKKLLAINSFGGTGEHSGTDIFAWDGTQMLLVLDGKGFLERVETSGENGEFALIFQDLARDPSFGGCVGTQTTYQWDGVQFIQTNQSQEASDCFDGSP